MDLAKRRVVIALACIAALGLIVFAFFTFYRPAAPSIELPVTTPSTAPMSAGKVVPTLALTPGPDPYGSARLEMVKFQIAERGITDTQVLEVLNQVPRHEFVPPERISQAYEDHPLPIGYGQTISQPYIVALMTQLLELKPGDKVLEIGTGSGYQAAVLAELTDKVYTIEIIPQLAAQAAERFKRLGYDKIIAKTGDGYFGWEEHAPFDAIIVTAAPDHVPPPLVQQLKEGGRMVIPVGPPGSYQTLWRIIKRDGQVSAENITGVVFVPLVRQAQ